jgi:hypothetical protein
VHTNADAQCVKNSFLRAFDSADFVEKKELVRPCRLSWAEMIMKHFKRNPLIDSRGQLMQHVGQYFPVAA